VQGSKIGGGGFEFGAEHTGAHAFDGAGRVVAGFPYLLGEIPLIGREARRSQRSRVAARALAMGFGLADPFAHLGQGLQAGFDECGMQGDGHLDPPALVWPEG
jgi:hypothetical protein